MTGKGEQQAIPQGQWSSSWFFILAATGAAVGLGNIWKFPYITGMNGGGAFVLVYLLCIIVIGIPLLMAEILVGRRGRQNPANSLGTLARQAGRSKQWRYLGLLGIAASFLILSYYGVIAGWALDYAFKSALGGFNHASAQQVAQVFTTLTQSPGDMLLWHSVIMLVTVLIVACGVEKGLEKAVQWMFPIMLILLLLLLGYAYETGYFSAGVRFLFHPDFSQLSSHGFLAALGHAFFTLSLATGSIMMYGAYLPKHASITKAALAIAVADTGVALIAGLVIFPIVFSNHLQAGAGPGLIFKTLPIAFGHMPYGSLFATLFFSMLVFAALTSAISLLEPSVAFIIENTRLNRRQSAWLVGGAIWLCGIVTVLSFNEWEHVRIFGLGIFDALDYLTANILLPLGGLCIACFVAWVMKRDVVLEELVWQGCPRLFRLWRWALGVVTPLAILLIFLKVVGVINL